MSSQIDSKLRAVYMAVSEVVHGRGELLPRWTSSLRTTQTVRLPSVPRLMVRLRLIWADCPCMLASAEGHRAKATRTDPQNSSQLSRRGLTRHVLLKTNSQRSNVLANRRPRRKQSHTRPPYATFAEDNLARNSPIEEQSSKQEFCSHQAPWQESRRVSGLRTKRIRRQLDIGHCLVKAQRKRRFVSAEN
ncbi:hypothetical protein GGD64_007692 [Bradyrhizobium sp. CIR3A]|nr:hypothetical protein [Bradyrhizobium sp. CIR3A]